jgi:hypothetical protein
MKTILFAASLLIATPLTLPAQNQTPPANPATTGADKTGDVPQSNRFWQASLGGGHYMVALDRISAISRHQYVLNGTALVDEVTVDSLGQALVRFYFISPITDTMTGSGLGNVASRVTDRSRDLIDRAANVAGTDVQNRVMKNYPDTTHARSIEYRLLSEPELTSLYNSVRTAWESGKGRKFTIK